MALNSKRINIVSDCTDFNTVIERIGLLVSIRPETSLVLIKKGQTK